MDFSQYAFGIGPGPLIVLVGRSPFLIALCLLVASCGEEAQPRGDETASPRAAAYLVRAQDAFRAARFATATALTDSAEAWGSESESFLADVHFLRAKIYGELNRGDSARIAYERTLLLRPDYRGAHLNLGNDAFRDDRFSEAIEHYRAEYEQHADPKLLVYIGRSYAELGESVRARDSYRQALDIDASLAEAYVRLSELLESEGDPVNAIPHARRAVELQPENPGFRYLLGRLLLRTGESEEALEHLLMVSTRRPHDHEIRYNIGQVLARLGRSAEASAHLSAADSLRDISREVNEWETLARLHPGRPAVWATYGFALEAAGRDAEAVRAHNVALYLDPANPDVRFVLGNLYLKRGELEAALAHYNWVLEQDTSRVEAWVNAGIAQARGGDLDAARKSWQTVLRLEPRHPAAAAYLSDLEHVEGS